MRAPGAGPTGRRRGSLAAALAAATALGWAGAAWSAPITFHTALSVCGGNLVLGERLALDGSGGDANGAEPGVPAGPFAYTFRGRGLVRPFCAHRLEEKLEAVPGVAKVEIDMGGAVVTITMAKGVALDEATFREAVEDAGFALRGFEQADATGRARPKE